MVSPCKLNGIFFVDISSTPCTGHSHLYAQRHFLPLFLSTLLQHPFFPWNQSLGPSNPHVKLCFIKVECHFNLRNASKAIFQYYHVRIHHNNSYSQYTRYLPLHIFLSLQMSGNQRLSCKFHFFCMGTLSLLAR